MVGRICCRLGLHDDKIIERVRKYHDYHDLYQCQRCSTERLQEFHPASSGPIPRPPLTTNEALNELVNDSRRVLTLHDIGPGIG